MIGLPWDKEEKLLGKPDTLSTCSSGMVTWTYSFDWTPHLGTVTFTNGRVKEWHELTLCV